MRRNLLLLVGTFVFGGMLVASAGNMQRIGHTTLLPRHSNPDEKGMYTAFIDPTNGYAYFVGTYLFKLDITGDLPVQVGPALNSGQSISSAIDVAAGYAYLVRTTLDRYALGVGTNAVSSAGSLTLTAGGPNAVVLDDSDPDPTKHNAYVFCSVSGNPGRVAKVALGTFTELGAVTLQAGETNSVLGNFADARRGYAYFVIAPNSASSNAPQVVKIKMTAGTNPPVRIGAVALDTVAAFVDGGSIDTLHGYAYYGTYDSNTNNPGKVYKVKLEEGDVPPTLVGHTTLRAGEGRLAASFMDAEAGFVYFADDNTYPGGVYQLSLNGTNLPIEINYLQLQGGPSNHPPNGVTGPNTTTNSDGVLPYGEVFFRSAVFDPIRGYAYLGQDSRPNQLVKIKVAKVDPFLLTQPRIAANGTFQFAFSNIAGATFTAFATTNLSLPFADWTAVGSITETAPGQYEFLDPEAPNDFRRFYVIRAP